MRRAGSLGTSVFADFPHEAMRRPRKMASVEKCRVRLTCIFIKRCVR